MTQRREPVSIVCVFNDVEVRRDCLDRSIATHLASAPDTEYLPVDNTDHAFSSAGAALNHGARQAQHAVVVFVHQDVYLHSLVALEEAAGRLADDPSVGILGAVGVAADGEVVGRLRDRVVMLGRPVSMPTTVDTLDEVLFMIARERVLASPLSEHVDLSWHAYAAEYSLRARAEGRRAVALDLCLTHNSMTINLARLDEAHGAVGAMYADQLPVQTTCGRIGEPLSDSVLRRLAGRNAWRRAWLRESRAAHAARRAVGSTRVVLVDIRRELDDLLDAAAAAGAPAAPPLLVLNAVAAGRPFGDDPEGTRLRRRSHDVEVAALPLGGLRDRLRVLPDGASALVTDIGTDDLATLAADVAGREHVVGYHGGFGYWVLLGPLVRSAPTRWASRRARPLGLPGLQAADACADRG